jgi:lipoprotein-anchoring transpeptidase ErfK/SrfK
MGASAAVRSVCVLVGATIATVAAQSQPQSQPSVPPAVELQVLLDRAGFSSGEIDGRMGRNTTLALAAYREAKGQAPQATAGTEILTTYEITTADVAGPFATSIPADLMEQSRLPALDYTSPIEAIAEKFHASPALLTSVNPGVPIEAGRAILVPNVIVAGLASEVRAAKVVVSRSGSAARAFDAAGQVVFHAPVTSGSVKDPLPLGTWTVTAVQKNPAFHYNPDLFWDADPAHSKAKIPPGPNNPVGLVWIDISREHYGLHGTPEPGKIGHTSSHGCVRLTNWDALRLAALVAKGTPVIFER